MSIHLVYVLAYLDPGAGSYLIQFLFAGVLGVLFSVKLYWKKVVTFFSGRPEKAGKDDTLNA